jgi:hypothetical protein
MFFVDYNGKTLIFLFPVSSFHIPLVCIQHCTLAMHLRGVGGMLFRLLLFSCCVHRIETLRTCESAASPTHLLSTGFIFLEPSCLTLVGSKTSSGPWPCKALQQQRC